MATWAIFSDLHAGVRGDNQTVLDHQRQFFEDVFFPYLDAHPDITKVFMLGDLMDDRRYGTYSTLNAWKEFFFRQIQIRPRLQVRLWVGNHDMPYRDSLRAHALRQVVPDLPQIRVVDLPQVMTVDGRDILALPWLCAENEAFALKLVEDHPAALVMGHLELKDFDLYRGQTQKTGLDKAIFSAYDLVLSGHYHHASRQANVQYVGAPYELTWSDAYDPRGFWVMDSETLAMEFIQNPHRLFYLVTYDDAQPGWVPTVPPAHRYVKLVVKSKSNPRQFDKFVATIQATDPADLQILDGTSVTVSPTGELDYQAVSPAIDTLKLIDEVTAQSSADPAIVGPLQMAMRELYQQALDVHAHTNH
jgi:DNA repair exonuclease SbcCD nuclease subunit